MVSEEHQIDLWEPFAWVYHLYVRHATRLHEAGSKKDMMPSINLQANADISKVGVVIICCGNPGSGCLHVRQKPR